MSPERLDHIWWLFNPGEQFTDSLGTTVANDFENPIPIRVHETPVGLHIQAFGNNYFIDGANNFEEVVTQSDYE